MYTIWYIHGAGASARSFAWLQAQFLPHRARFFSYSSDESVPVLSKRLRAAIQDENVPVSLIGHSLGGVIAATCASLPQVTKLVTLCAPFGGIRQADFFSLFSWEPLFHDLRSHGPVLSSLRRWPIGVPHLAFVGTNGLPFMFESNDGAITVASQTALNGPQYKMLPLNHFEVLLSSEVAELSEQFIFAN